MHTLTRGSLAVAASLLLLVPACTLDVSSDAPAAAGREQSGRSRVELVQSDRRPPRSNVSSVVERVLPSVVNVRVTALGALGFGGEPSRGEGSGVIIASDGIILTNAHVIRQALEVTVVLEDGRKLGGEVIGSAPERDLAVIEVDADDLEPITLGHSEGPAGPRLGDPVVALGFPLGLGGPTVTAGIVSGKNRRIEVEDGGAGVNRLVNLLQTDAAINPGNSGGALVDMSGRLIGINSAAALASSAENVGFAIAIDDALPVVREILSEPQEQRAWLGVQVTDVDATVASQLGLPEDVRGAAVAGLIPDSPAEDAGIEEDEVIVGIDDVAITSATDLTETLTQRAPGDEVEVRLASADGRRSVTIELAQRPVSFER
ncbi:hypothetical protein BH24ACT26_BH24ACT26_09440 [soil metagenome]